MIIKTVEIFKTDVDSPADASEIISGLTEIFPTLKLNFDLEDCDHILRVEGNNPDLNSISAYLTSNGFCCELLK